MHLHFELSIVGWLVLKRQKLSFPFCCLKKSLVLNIFMHVKYVNASRTTEASADFSNVWDKITFVNEKLLIYKTKCCFNYGLRLEPAKNVNSATKGKFSSKLLSESFLRVLNETLDCLKA